MAKSRAKEVVESVKWALRVVRGLYFASRDEGFIISVYRTSKEEEYLAYFYPPREKGTVMSIKHDGPNTIIRIRKHTDGKTELDRSLN